MADKHLDSGDWKSLAKEHKLKGAVDLEKALAAWGKLDADDDPDERLAALDDVDKEAKSLRADKSVKANDELDDWLDQVQKESAKARKEVLADKKAAEEKEDEGGEDEGEDGDEAALGTRLLQGLVRVRNGKGKVTAQFVACVARPFWGLMVAKRVKPKQKLQLKEATGGKRFVTGTCVFEEQAFTFIVEKVGGGLASKLKSAIKAHTGKQWRVRVRDAAGTAVLDGDTDVEGADDENQFGEEEAAEGAAAPPPPPPPPPPAGDLQALERRRAKVVEGIQKAAALKNPAIAGKLKEATLAASEAGVFLRKGDAAGAVPLVARAAALLQEALAAASREKIAPAATATGDAQAGAGPSRDGLKAWQAARSSVLGPLKDVAATLKGSKHPEAVQAQVELGAIVKQIKGDPATLQQVLELERWLQQDQIVADVCELAFDLRTPLLGALSELRAELEHVG